MFFKRWFWRLFLLLAGLVFAYQFWIFGHVVYWNSYNPSSSAFMEDRLAVLRQGNTAAALRMQWVPYERISPNLKRAIIAAEDSRFLAHEGFDFDAIQNAYQKNVKKRKLVAGGSTISQQLAKNLFLSSEKTAGRKIQEAVITLMLEHVMSKRRILEIYLNVIEWGNGVFGAGAAIHYYYGVSASSITAEQAARLAAMITNPRFYDKHRNTPWLSKKTGIILSRMASAQIP
jgi:monofunctional biosynthetic peptidoglycan transglycosylase